MAYPTVRARTETALTTAGTTITINFGTNNAGDLCIAFIGLSDTAQAITTTESFTNLTNASATFHIIYKVLAGTEGTSTTVTVPVATKAAVIAYTINTGTFLSTQAPQFSTVATGTSTGPNSSSLTPTGGPKDFLWIAAFRQNGEEADDDTWVTAVPTTPGTFTNLLQKTSGTVSTATTNGSIASAEYTSYASSMDPGAFTVAQNLAWRAYTVAVHPLYNTFSSTFTANAVIKGTVTPTGWKADATQKRTQSATFFIGNNDGTGGAVIAIASTTYTFTDKKADAVITKTQVPAGGTKADAVVKKEMSGSAWTVNAVIRKTFEPSFTANAAILKTWATASQTFTANAAILKTLSPTGFTLDAIFLASSGTRTFASDAVILAPSDTRTFAANAVISKTQVGSYLADAIRLATQSLTFLIGDAVDPGGAVIVVAQQTVEGSFTANAVLLKLGAGGLTAGAVITRTFTPTGYLSDAVIRREQAGSFAANAVVSKSQTGSLAVNAVTRKAVTGSLTSDAIRLRTFYFGSGPDPR